MENNFFETNECCEIKQAIKNNEIKLEELDNALLERLLDFETEMLCHGSGDLEFMRRCADLLCERDELLAAGGEKELLAIFEKTLRENVTVIPDANTNPLPQVKRSYLKRLCLVAAAMALLLVNSFFIIGSLDSYPLTETVDSSAFNSYVASDTFPESAEMDSLQASSAPPFSGDSSVSSEISNEQSTDNDESALQPEDVSQEISQEEVSQEYIEDVSREESKNEDISTEEPDLPSGDEEGDPFTYYSNGGSTKYQSLQELVSSEGLNILYPKTLPEGASVHSVNAVGNKITINIIGKQISFSVAEYNPSPATPDEGDDVQEGEPNEGAPQFSPEGTEIITPYPDRNGFYHAFFQHGSHQYKVESKSYEDLIFIINNMSS